MPDSTVVTIQVSGEASRETCSRSAGWSTRRRHRSDGPSNSTNSTNGPRISSAASLTTDSKAIASIMPRCCSDACTLRTPNRMVNTAIRPATISDVSVWITPARLPSIHGVGSATARKVDDTACSCSAI